MNEITNGQGWSVGDMPSREAHRFGKSGRILDKCNGHTCATEGQIHPFAVSKKQQSHVISVI